MLAGRDGVIRCDGVDEVGLAALVGYRGVPVVACV